MTTVNTTWTKDEIIRIAIANEKQIRHGYYGDPTEYALVKRYAEETGQKHPATAVPVLLPEHKALTEAA